MTVKIFFKGSLFLELLGDRAVGIYRTECAGAVKPAVDMDPTHFVCELWLNPWVTFSGTLWQPHPNDPARDYAVHQEVPCSCTPVPSTSCATPPLCPTLPSALLFSSTSPHFCFQSQGEGDLSLLSLLNINTNVKQFVLHTRHTGNANSCWEKWVQWKFRCQLKCNICIHITLYFSPGCTCAIISTDFKGLACYKWIGENKYYTLTFILAIQSIQL